MKFNNKAGNTTLILFSIYLLATFWIIVMKFNISFPYTGYSRGLNLIPFAESFTRWGEIDLSEIIMNIVIFVPLGIYAGVIFKNWGIAKTILFFFFVSFLFEILQYILRVGFFDITDLITNTLGGMIGLAVYNEIDLITKDKVKTRKFINIIAITGTVITISLLVLLRTNHLWIFRMTGFLY